MLVACVAVWAFPSLLATACYKPAFPPQRASVGGNLTPQMQLAGITVLVVEDDFYLAEDERQLVEEAGGRVLGPFASAAETIVSLRDNRPDCALLDVSLSDGVSFDLARLIVSKGTPILFITGYDASILPEDLQNRPRLQKPTPCQKIIAAILALPIT
jgi:FixJ family two-component response regulator